MKGRFLQRFDLALLHRRLEKLVFSQTEAKEKAKQYSLNMRENLQNTSRSMCSYCTSGTASALFDPQCPRLSYRFALSALLRQSNGQPSDFSAIVKMMEHICFWQPLLLSDKPFP